MDTDRVRRKIGVSTGRQQVVSFVDEERDSWTCPFCGAFQKYTEGCEHFAIQRVDDAECGEGRGVFYATERQVTDALDDLYEAVLHLTILWSIGTHDAKVAIQQKLTDQSGEGNTLLELLKNLPPLKKGDQDCEDFEMVVHDLFYDDLKVWFRDLFNRLWHDHPETAEPKDYEIFHSPGLTWPGTNYWSANGKQCLPDICEKIGAISAGFRRAAEAVITEVENSEDAQESLDKASAWIEYYRSLGPKK